MNHLLRSLVLKGSRKKAKITAESPSYKCYYLGNNLTLQTRGKDCCSKAIEKILSRSEQGKKGAKLKLAITNLGLRCERINDDDKDKESFKFLADDTTFLFRRISFCSADSKLFVWVYRHEVKRKQVELRCHVVLCSKPEVAEDLHSSLNQACQCGLKNYIREKREREDRDLRLKILQEKAAELDMKTNNNVHKFTLPMKHKTTNPSNFHPSSKTCSNSTAFLGIIQEEDNC